MIAKRKVEQMACGFTQACDLLTHSDNATNFTTGRAAASLTSTTFGPQVVNERELLDEEECECSGPRLCRF